MPVNYKGKEIESVWTPANIVTCVRIVFIPIFMLLADASYSNKDGLLALVSFILYVLLSLTDKLDGTLARKREEITDFGKFLDPIADKLLVFAALLILLAHNQMNLWFVFIILLREFLVSALRMVSSANGEVIAADTMGKWKTASTMLALCGLLLSNVLVAFENPAFAWIDIASQIVMIIAVVLTVVSGLQYFWNARHVIFRV